VGTISLPVTFGTEVNFRIENVQFEVAEVNLPFNAIIGPEGILTVQGDRTAVVAAVEKLHTLVAGLAQSAGAEGSDPSPSRARVPAKAPKVRPSDTDDVPVKIIQVEAESSQTTRIGGNLGGK
jgi:hypothetical protein